MNIPKNKTAYRRWLREQYDAIEALVQYGEPDFFTGLEIAEMIEQASRVACRFGAGDLIGDELPTPTPRQALSTLGRLLAWQTEPPDLLSVEEVAGRLGTSVRSVWRMRSRGEIPQPVKISGKTKWRAVDVTAMIELMSPAKR